MISVFSVSLCDIPARNAGTVCEATKNSTPPSRRSIAISALKIRPQAQRSRLLRLFRPAAEQEGQDHTEHAEEGPGPDLEDRAHPAGERRRQRVIEP